jgi:ubiquinone/menaquinone biosynthesis C-methylase UbiE
MTTEIKDQVREFYDQVGWQEISDGLYQNARYEDLRPVSQEYIHRCHLRVSRHISPTGRYLLDAGSGPIQYPEYLEYSKGYDRRVCMDISAVALNEARERIGDHGLFVVADIANLPFKEGAFDGVVTLHTIHHLPESEHKRAFDGIHRTMVSGSSAVIVNGWDESTFSQLTDPLIALARRMRGQSLNKKKSAIKTSQGKQKGTYVQKHNSDWFKREIGSGYQMKIYVWRSLNVRFMRNFIKNRLGGRTILRFVYWFEERFPHFAGEHGAYPLIVVQKPD